MTLGQARVAVRNKLKRASDAPELDADRLLLHVLQQADSSYLSMFGAQPLTVPQEKKIVALARERATGKPLAYILGEAEFYGRLFAVTPAVLIPRPSTETLVAKALETISYLSRQAGRPITVADIGTGSGCVAITLALEAGIDVATMIATDISDEALAVAQQNIQRYAVADRVECLLGNMLEPLAHKPADLIVSNPPYVPTAELDRFPTAETAGLRFEPRVALDGGRDGLDYVRLLAQAGIPAVLETVGGDVITANVPL